MRAILLGIHLQPSQTPTAAVTVPQSEENVQGKWSSPFINALKKQNHVVDVCFWLAASASTLKESVAMIRRQNSSVLSSELIVMLFLQSGLLVSLSLEWVKRSLRGCSGGLPACSLCSPILDRSSKVPYSKALRPSYSYFSPKNCEAIAERPPFCWSNKGSLLLYRLCIQTQGCDRKITGEQSVLKL